MMNQQKLADSDIQTMLIERGWQHKQAYVYPLCWAAEPQNKNKTIYNCSLLCVEKHTNSLRRQISVESIKGCQIPS